MHADIDKLIHIKLEGKVALLLAKIETSYKRFMTYERGQPVIYAKFLKALYGTMQADLLFWKNLTSFLVDDMGFEVNPYDSCVVNKIVNGKQCTIAWHVDDLKISHAKPRVVDGLINKLKSKYGVETPLTVKRGKIHEYLGMTIDYIAPGKVSFSVPKYIDKLISETPESLFTRHAVTPAAAHLFDTQDGKTQLQ